MQERISETEVCRVLDIAIRVFRSQVRRVTVEVLYGYCMVTVGYCMGTAW